jgi:hypothetical protein
MIASANAGPTSITKHQATYVFKDASLSVTVDGSANLLRTGSNSDIDAMVGASFAIDVEGGYVLIQ